MSHCIISSLKVYFLHEEVIKHDKPANTKIKDKNIGLLLTKNVMGQDCCLTIKPFILFLNEILFSANNDKFNVYLKRFILLVILLFTACFTFSQSAGEKLYQFSGLVVTSDSSNPVANAHIRIKNTKWGTVSNYEGFFSIVVRDWDTLIVSSVGFRKKTIVIPGNTSALSFNIIIPLENDTVTFAEAIIYPWPTRDKFRQAFLELEPEVTLEERAKENLNQQKLIALSLGLPKDGREQQHLYMNSMAASAGYLGGQTNYAIFPGSNIPIPLSLMNPFAWAELIKAIKEGKFKRKE